MTLVFSVLGKILFILLMILCILLVLVLLILFAPIHYKVSVKKEDDVSVRGMVRWFFFVVYCPFSYQNGGTSYSVRIFGIPIKSAKREEKQKKEESVSERAEGAADLESGTATEDETAEQAETERGTGTEAGTADTEPEVVSGKKKEVREAGSVSREKKTKKEKAVSKKERRKTKRRLKREKKEKKKRQKEERQRKKRASKEKKNIRATMRAAVEKIREKAAWAGDVKSYLEEENTKEMVCILKDNVLHLLEKLKPKVLKGYLEFGSGDPAGTGQILGALACVYAFGGTGGIRVVPDFEEKKLLGHVFMRGRFSLITLLIIVLRVILNRRWKRFIREMKELKEAL